MVDSNHKPEETSPKVNKEDPKNSFEVFKAGVKQLYEELYEEPMPTGPVWPRRFRAINIDDKEAVKK